MERLELAILVKSTKRLEFKQTLYDLNEKLQKYCSSLKITESDSFLSYSILIQWETAVHMQAALKMEEFEILSGAIAALCDKVVVRLNGKLIGHDISKLKTL